MDETLDNNLPGCNSTTLIGWEHTVHKLSQIESRI